MTSRHWRMERHRRNSVESLRARVSLLNRTAQVTGGGEIHWNTHCRQELHENLPVLSGLAWRWDCTRRSLEVPLIIDIGRLLLDKRCTGQDKISRLSQLRQEHALYNQKAELA